MKCGKVERYLYGQAASGAGNPALQAEIERHIASCGRCRLLAEQLAALDADLGRTPEFDTIPPAEADALVRGAFIERRRIGRPWGFRVPKFAFAGLVAACAAMAIVLVPVIRQNIMLRRTHAEDVRRAAVPSVPVAAGDTATALTGRLLKGRTVSPYLPEPPDSVAEHQLSVARNMIEKGTYKMAIHVLEDYLGQFRYKEDSALFTLAYCYSLERRYVEATGAYDRIVDQGLDEGLVETALHRSNKILYMKLGDFGRARSGIYSYLKKYPAGKWRGEELYFAVLLALKEGLTAEADSLSRVFASEFPHNCRAKTLLKNKR